MKVLDNINFHITKNRSIYLVCVVAFLVISLVTFFVLRNLFKFEYEGVFFAVWSVFSILIGSLVFFQLNESNLYKDLEGVMILLNQMMEEILEDRKLSELYIITPNLNIGQTKCSQHFNEFKNRISELTEKKKSINISVWGLEDKLYLFYPNNLFTHFTDCENGSGRIIDKETHPHLSYVANLLKNAPPEKNRSPFTLLSDYNSFIQSFNNECIKIFRINSSEDITNLFFLIYNGKKLFYSTIKNDSSMSSELIRESEFIKTIWPSLKNKYFNTQIVF